MGIKIVLTNQQLQKIRELFDLGQGTRKIAKKLSLGRYVVKGAFKQLGISNIGRKLPRQQIIPIERWCRQCLTVIPIENFRKRIRKNGRIEFEYYCAECLDARERVRSKNVPRDKKKKYSNKYANKETTKQKKRAYYLTNREILSKKQRERDNRKRHEDPFYRLRHRVSCAIWQYLTRSGGGKYGRSCLQYLPYTIPELKNHLEALWEPWMTRDNYGPYRKLRWNDDDPATWTWQIDHIIPHSTLPYTSMEDENFQKAWALENLRPYSAKQNFLDGINRVRHS